MPAEEDIKLPEAKMSVVVKGIRKTAVAKTQEQREKVHKETGSLQGLEHDELAHRWEEFGLASTWKGKPPEGFKEMRT